jgi:hypothetical protein
VTWKGWKVGRLEGWKRCLPAFVPFRLPAFPPSCLPAFLPYQIPTCPFTDSMSFAGSNPTPCLNTVSTFRMSAMVRYFAPFSVPIESCYKKHNGDDD